MGRCARVASRGLLLVVFVVLGAFLGAGVAAAQDTETAPVAGRLVDAGEPVAGAVVRIINEAGEEADTATSDDSGRWNVELPVGTYTFEVDPESLPDGVSVQSAVTRDVIAGRTNAVVFIFGEVRTRCGDAALRARHPAHHRRPAIRSGHRRRRHRAQPDLRHHRAHQLRPR